LEMLLQGGKKRVIRSGEREIIFHVHKFMKTESEKGICLRAECDRRVELTILPS
jgi:hypothetical protein